MAAHRNRVTLRFAQLAFAVGVLLLWEYASGRWIPTLFVSKPSLIAIRLQDLAASGDLLFHAGVTATHALGGFALGATLGLGVGLLLGRLAFLANLLDPFLMAFYSLPKVALAPLFVLWFGIGVEMKVLFVAMIVFFLVFLNTYTGVRQVSREQITVLRLMGADERHILTKVILPSAVTWVFAGLRLSVPYALIGAIIGELIASNRGLGYLLSDATAQFNTAGAFAALATIMLMAMVLNACVRLAERLLMPWQATGERREVSV